MTMVVTRRDACRIGATSFALLLAGCEASRSRRKPPDSGRPEPGADQPSQGPEDPSIVWIPLLGYVPRERAVVELTQYSEMLLGWIADALNRSLDVPSTSVSVEVDPSNRETFGYYNLPADGDSPSRIVFGLRSLLILAHVSQAMTLAQTIPRDDRDDWTTMYLLYLRANTWDRTPEPAVLWGVTKGEHDACASASEPYFRQFVAFLVAHELGHAVFHHGPSAGLDDSTRRRREELADEFAVRALMVDDLIQEQTGFSGGLLFFIASMQMDGSSLVDRTSHPSDPERALAYANLVGRLELTEKMPEAQREAIRRSAASLAEKSQVAMSSPDLDERLSRAAHRIRREHMAKEQFLKNGAAPLH